MQRRHILVKSYREDPEEPPPPDPPPRAGTRRTAPCPSREASDAMTTPQTLHVTPSDREQSREAPPCTRSLCLCHPREAGGQGGVRGGWHPGHLHVLLPWPQAGACGWRRRVRGQTRGCAAQARRLEHIPRLLLASTPSSVKGEGSSPLLQGSLGNEVTPSAGARPRAWHNRTCSGGVGVAFVIGVTGKPMCCCRA